MKKIITIIATLLFTGAMAQGPEVIVESEIKSVTVFLNGAQINREASVKIPAGKSTLVFVGLTQYLNVNSIQLQGSDEFTIVSVNNRTNYIDGMKNNPEVDELVAEIEQLQLELQQIQAMQTVYTEERTMILANQNISTQNMALDIDDLLYYADFYRERLQNIENELIDLEESIYDINEEISALQLQLNELTSNASRYTSEVLVNVTSSSATTANMRLSYVVSSAGWLPMYDVRAEDLNSAIRLTYKGSVYQNTGNDWKNVSITLSTGNPNQSGTPPVVSPWVLSFAQDYRFEYNQPSGYYNNVTAPVYDESAWGGNANYAYQQNISNYVTVGYSSVSTEFEISIPYSIPTDGQYHDVEVQQNALAVDFNYYAAPKLDQDAFLLAKVSGWEEYNLLPGMANVYFKGTYVGQSFLNTQTTADTLELSLGRDKDIVINREKLKDFTNSGNKNKVTVTMEISVRNTKNVTVLLDLEDQIPLTQQKDLEVTLIESNDAQYNENKGQLLWDLILGPGETQTYTFTYELKYPSDMELSGF